MFSPIELVGLPCEEPCNPPHSFNCWELVRYVRKQCFELDTPLITRDVDYTAPAEAIRDLVETGYIAQWMAVDGNPGRGDVAMLASQDEDLFNHVGVFLGPTQMLHATTSTVMLTGLPVIRRVYKAIKVYRWPFATS